MKYTIFIILTAMQFGCVVSKNNSLFGESGFTGNRERALSQLESCLRYGMPEKELRMLIIDLLGTRGPRIIIRAGPYQKWTLGEGESENRIYLQIELLFFTCEPHETPVIHYDRDAAITFAVIRLLGNDSQNTKMKTSGLY